MREHRFSYRRDTRYAAELPPCDRWLCLGCGLSVWGTKKPKRRSLKKLRLGRDCDEELALRVLRS